MIPLAIVTGKFKLFSAQVLSALALRTVASPLRGSTSSGCVSCLVVSSAYVPVRLRRQQSNFLAILVPKQFAIANHLELFEDFSVPSKLYREFVRKRISLLLQVKSSTY